LFIALTCREAGYNGCCDKNTDPDTCFVYFGFCFCDRDCHKRGDCCTDIIDIGCRAGNGTVDSLLNHQATENPNRVSFVYTKAHNDIMVIVAEADNNEVIMCSWYT